MADSNGGGEGPRKATYDVGLDWNNGTVVFREASAEGLSLVNPQTFAFPMETVLGIAHQISTHLLGNHRAALQQHLKMGIIPGGRKG